MTAPPGGFSASVNAHSASAAQDIVPAGRDLRPQAHLIAGAQMKEEPALSGAEHGTRLDPAPWRAAPVTVAVSGFARLARLGLIGILRSDPRVRLLDVVDEAGLEDVVARGSVHVAVLGEPTAQLVLALRVIEPDIGLLVLAREPTPTYGRALVGCGVSCLDWDACSNDIHAAIYLAAHGGCMFVSSADRVEYADWRENGLLTERQRVVLTHHLRDDSYEQIALELEISVSTVKKHTAVLCRRLKAASKRDLSKLLILARA